MGLGYYGLSWGGGERERKGQPPEVKSKNCVEAATQSESSLEPGDSGMWRHLNRM